MVYRVCWRVLQHSQDSEDAFQSTFLLLAQKLRTVQDAGSGIPRKSKVGSSIKSRHSRRCRCWQRAKIGGRQERNSENLGIAALSRRLRLLSSPLDAPILSARERILP